MNKNGCVLIFIMISALNLILIVKNYLKVIKNIPLQLIIMLKGILTYSTVIPKILDLKLCKISFVDNTRTNKFMCRKEDYMFVSTSK